MIDLIRYLVSKIVNKPEEIEIEESIENHNGRTYKIYSVKVNAEDVRLLIGKNGRTIQSIRNLIKVKAVKDNEFVDVKIKEDAPYVSTAEI